TNISKSGDNYGIWSETSEGKIWAVGSPSNASSFDQIIYSSNNGNSWTVQPTNNAAILTDIQMTNPTTGYVVGDNGKILKTNNSGLNWNSIASPTNETLSNVRF